ncbi:hypothetical protein EDD11_006531 [Mortierella claussenii]|nr:hypothetical protein EDD11_006531 [Mortierella claussenii]
MIGSSLYGSLSCSPPPPPTAQHIEQLDSIREQQYQFQQQLQMETHQKQRQQGELNEVLLKHRMALFEQRLISRWSNFTEERLEYRQRQIVRQALSQEYQQAAPTRVQMIENNASISREEYDLMLSPAQN